ncbi:MAG: helix-turn-helix transcriptional regulator [Oscillibacter sp.]|nr:helix-turn-helix transcriptional regulator [Oscillibacter sp.]
MAIVYAGPLPLCSNDYEYRFLERDCISRIENSLRMVQDFELRAIAEALGVTADWLLEVEEKHSCRRLYAYGNCVFRMIELLFSTFSCVNIPQKKEG